jgi:hypothetical protein
MEYQSKIKGEKLEIVDAVRAIALEKGWDYFRCEANTNYWLRVNSDSEKWHNSNVHSNEIAIFSPLVIRDKLTNAPIAAITFAGKCVRLKSIPDWKPLNLEELQKGPSKINKIHYPNFSSS